MVRRFYSFKLKAQEGGYAAFTATLIIMVVISLIVLGFANNARNEQQRGLNNQLSLAAYYAAESGINDAYAIIKADLATGIQPPAQTQACHGPAYDPSASSTVLGPSGASPTNYPSYSCLLVNPTPPSLQYSPIDVGHGQVVPLFGVSQASGHPVSVRSVTISWQESGLSPSARFTGCPTTPYSFPAQANWSNCGAGMLQVDLVPASGWSTVQQLQAATQSYFLEPLYNSGSGGHNTIENVGTTSNGVDFGTTCGSGREYACTITLQNLPAAIFGPPGRSQAAYYLHIVPIYENADVTVTAAGCTGLGACSRPVDLADAQASVDSTGQDGSELKRIEERISINPVGDNNQPPAALQTQNSLTKQFTTRPGCYNTTCPY